MLKERYGTVSSSPLDNNSNKIISYIKGKSSGYTTHTRKVPYFSRYVVCICVCRHDIKWRLFNKFFFVSVCCADDI